MSRTLRDASSISALTLLSRVLGFVRDVIMFRLLGTGWVMGTFVLAWMLPNLLRRLVGEGALSASFIPAFASTLDREGRPAARRLLGSVSGALLLGLCALSALVLVLCATLPPEMLGHASENGATARETGALLLQLTAILFPYVILICLVAVYSGALNSLSVFAWPAALPVVLNVFWIGGLIAGAVLFAGRPVALTVVTAVFLMVGGVVQLVLVAMLLARHDCLAAPSLPRRGDPARAVFASMAPTVLGMSMLQINNLADQGFAYYLIDPGANSHVYMANRMMSFPHALTSVALATAVFPQFAVLASRAQMHELRGRVGEALRMTFFLSVPASVGLILVAPDFIELCFAHGEFGAEDAYWSAMSTSCLVAGLPFLSSAQLYTRALYALGDMAAPAVIACALVPLNLGLNAVFLFGLELGVPGLMLATSLCAVLNAWWLRRRFAARCPGEPPAGTAIARVLLAAAVMAGVVLAWQAWVEVSGDLQVAVWRLVVPITVGAGAYLGVHWLAGGEEMRRLMRRARGGKG